MFDGPIKFFWAKKFFGHSLIEHSNQKRPLRMNSGGWISIVYLGCGPLPVTVTTRIVTFLVGNPYKPSFATVTGRGQHPKFTHMIYELCSIHINIINTSCRKASVGGESHSFQLETFTIHFCFGVFSSPFWEICIPLLWTETNRAYNTNNNRPPNYRTVHCRVILLSVWFWHILEDHPT